MPTAQTVASDRRLFDASLQGMCEKHVAELSIDTILSGTAMGHPIRWAREYIRDHDKDTDEHLVQLKAHYNAALAAQSLATTKLKDYESEKLANDLAKLSDFGDAFPTVLKHEVLERYIEDQLANDGKLEDIVGAMIPWKSGDHDGSWSPTRPKLSQIDIENGRSSEISASGFTARKSPARLAGPAFA